MSKKEVKTVKITENALVDLIDEIVNEALKEKKKEWIAEQEAKEATILENRINELESKIKAITESK